MHTVCQYAEDSNTYRILYELEETLRKKLSCQSNNLEAEQEIELSNNDWTCLGLNTHLEQISFIAFIPLPGCIIRQEV